MRVYSRHILTTALSSYREIRDVIVQGGSYTGDSNVSQEHGICYNLKSRTAYAAALTAEDLNTIGALQEELAYGWPEFSGDPIYPVPYTIEIFDALDDEDISEDATSLAGEQYECTDDMWAGEYGRLRMGLLNYLIGRIEEMLAELDEPPQVEAAPVTAKYYKPTHGGYPGTPLC